MKNPFTKLIHHYTYDMRLKTKLVISHIILVLLPTAVLSGFLYLRIYGIVMDDSIRSEQALSAQTVTSIESLVSHVGTPLTPSPVHDGTGSVPGTQIRGQYPGYLHLQDEQPVPPGAEHYGPFHDYGCEDLL